MIVCGEYWVEAFWSQQMNTCRYFLVTNSLNACLRNTNKIRQQAFARQFVSTYDNFDKLQTHLSLSGI